jgi:hypothetical protein
VLYKTLTVILGCVLLVSCNALQPLESGNVPNKDFDVSGTEYQDLDGELGLSGTEYQVPDYYSTQQLDKSQQIGQTYYVKDLRCEGLVNRCRY